VDVCDSAIVLLDRKALESEWVRREVTLLMSRHALDALQVVPVLLDGVGAADVRAAKLAEVEELQFADIAGSTAAGDYYVRRAVKEIAGQFAPVTTSSMAPEQRWVRAVTSCLTGVSKAALQTAATALGMGEDEACQVRRINGCRFLATHLARGLDERVYVAVGELAGEVASGDLSKLVDLISPMWVDASAARCCWPMHCAGTKTGRRA
jgi:hypothetical protein